MQLTTDVRNIFSKRPQRLEDCKLEWKWKAVEERPKVPAQTGPPDLTQPPPPLDAATIAKAREQMVVTEWKRRSRELGVAT